MPLLSRQRTIGLREAMVGAGMMALLPVAGFPAAAQQAGLSPKECRDAVSVSTAIMTKYRGKISGKLAASFGQFRDSKCDLSTPFTRVDGTADEDAFTEFRVRLIALRMADAARPAELAKR